MHFQNRCIACGSCKAVCPLSLDRRGGDGCQLCYRCADICPTTAVEAVGKEYSPKELIAVILKERQIHELSGGGVTLSGGEVMSVEIGFLVELLKLLKREEIHVVVDTSGYAPFEKFMAVLPYVDVFLYDLKSAIPQKHRHFVGADIDLISDNLQKLLAAGANVHLRLPIIENVNTADEDITALLNLLSTVPKNTPITLLPYHRAGENKRSSLGYDVNGDTFATPSREKLMGIKKRLADNGFNAVHIE